MTPMTELKAVSTKPEQDGDAEPVDHAGGDVAALVVGTEPILGRGRRGRGNGQIVVDGIEAVADRRPHDPSFRFDELRHEGVPVIGLRLEIAAEPRFRIGREDRHQELALVGDEDRLVVGDELGEEAQDEERREDPEGPVAAPVGAEVLQTPPGQRRDAEPQETVPARDLRPHQATSRRSKSIRGSMTTYMRSPSRLRTRPSRVKT